MSTYLSTKVQNIGLRDAVRLVEETRLSMNCSSIFLCSENVAVQGILSCQFLVSRV